MFHGLEKKVDEREPVVGYVYTTELPALLADLRITFVVTTYQAQRILVITSNGNGSPC